MKCEYNHCCDRKHYEDKGRDKLHKKFILLIVDIVDARKPF